MRTLARRPWFWLAVGIVMIVGGLGLFVVGGLAMESATADFRGCAPINDSNPESGISCSGAAPDALGLEPALGPGSFAQAIGATVLSVGYIPGIRGIRVIGAPKIARRLFAAGGVVVAVVMLATGYELVESGSALAVRIATTCNKEIYCMNVQSGLWMVETQLGTLGILLGAVLLVLSAFLFGRASARLWSARLTVDSPDSE